MSVATKVTALYYIGPDPESFVDPTMASSKIRIEVGGQESSITDFYCTYELTVCTIRFIMNEVEQRGSFGVRSVLIVKSLSDTDVLPAVDAALPRLAEFAVLID